MYGKPEINYIQRILQASYIILCIIKTHFKQKRLDGCKIYFNIHVWGLTL